MKRHRIAHELGTRLGHPWFTRDLFHFETPDAGAGGGDAGAGAAAAAPPAAEAGAAAPGAQEPGGGTPSPVAAAPTWADDPAFHQAVAEQAQAQLDAYLEAAGGFGGQQQPQGGGFDLENFDPTDPVSFAAFLEARDTHMLGEVRQMMAPLQQQAQAAAAAEGQARLADVVADVRTRTGIELPPELEQIAVGLANQEMLGMIQANPALAGNGRLAESIVERSIRDLGTRLDGYAQAYHERKLNELSTASGAGARPPAPGTQGAEVPGEYETEADAAKAFAARLTQV